MLKQNNILVIRLSSLGDVLMTIPAVKAIRERFPEGYISWLVEGSVGEFLKHQDFINEVIIFPRTGLTKELGRCNIFRAGHVIGPFLRQLRERKYDLVIDFHGIAKSVMLSMAAHGKKRIGFGDMFAKEKSHFFYHKGINGADKRMHKVERNMLLARYLGYAGPIPEVTLSTSDNAVAYIKGFFNGLDNAPPAFVVNPFSSRGTDFKRWPLENYAGLIARIHRELAKTTIILWGPGEEKEARRLKEMSGQGAYLACPTNIPQLFALLTKIPVYIGGDTGVMHLAAAAGTTVISLFGPTDFKINGPYGKKHIVIREDTPCSPCKKKDCVDRQCLIPITVNKVFESINTVLARNRTN